jgi:hypothetical protein
MIAFYFDADLTYGLAAFGVSSLVKCQWDKKVFITITLYLTLGHPDMLKLFWMLFLPDHEPKTGNP